MKVKDSVYIGFALGLIGAFAGTLLIYLSRFSYMGVLEYYQTIWDSRITGPIISLGAILNLLVFFLLYWLKFFKMARGVIASMFFLVVIVLILKFI
ncbi:MAG: hypothetical protein EA412_04125 [Chitinophagaceae bacterium]|nr:MAG: hypothetical protein EA412_04125 [Chitinophagaceae bacterium]